MLNVRQTAALVVPSPSAATMAASFSASIAMGRPPRRPRRRAAARPALTRSCVKDRSNCASAPKTWNRNSPCGVVVSICSVNERNATPRSFRLFTVVNRCGSDPRQTLLAFVRLIEKRILDALLGPVVRATDQPFKQRERRIDKAGLDIAQGRGHDSGALRRAHLLESLCGEAQEL
jgi:hypothetical protein